MSNKPRILLLGHGRAGKDESATHISRIAQLKNAGSTSKYLCPRIAEAKGISEDEAWNTRRENREFWKEFGSNLRRHDPGLLVRECYENGDISCGLRDFEEVEWVIANNFVTHILWVYADVPKDTTMGYTLEDIAQLLAKYKSSIHLDLIPNWERSVPQLPITLFRWCKLRLLTPQYDDREVLQNTTSDLAEVVQ